VAQYIARDYGLNPSSLHRHRVNCIKLASSTKVMKETARSTAALASLPSKEELGNALDAASLTSAVCAKALCFTWLSRISDTRDTIRGKAHESLQSANCK
jgi:hypothetical protein